MGRLTLTFVTVLFHQMNKNKIPLNILYLSNIIFNNTSSYIDYLKNNNYYNIFSTENDKYAVSIIPIDNSPIEVFEASILSVAIIFTSFQANDMDYLINLVCDTTLNFSKKYNTEIEYIDKLIANDELGWNKDLIKSFNNFKKTMNSIFNEADTTYELLRKYNSYVPMHEYKLLSGYKLRFVNDILNTFNKLKLKVYIDKCQIMNDNIIQLKSDLLSVIRPKINSIKNPSEFYTLPKNANIYEYFQHLIENCDDCEYNLQKYDSKYIELLKDNTKIQNIVRRMLFEFSVPLQSVRPIVYNYYNLYTKEEQFFLE
jgi:hypothetical protein